jgi:hypothetical protein
LHISQKNITFAADLKKRPTMETTMTTVQITLPISDARFLKRLSGNMGWMLARPTSKQKSVVSGKTKITMTKEEFCTKVRQSSAQKAEGKTIAMQANETSEQFLNRLLCM